MVVDRMEAVLDCWDLLTLQLLAAIIANLTKSEITKMELTLLKDKTSSRKFRGGAAERLLNAGELK